jgi:soluble lytic murein transglycosylase-like protein
MRFCLIAVVLLSPVMIVQSLQAESETVPLPRMASVVRVDPRTGRLVRAFVPVNRRMQPVRISPQSTEDSPVRDLVADAAKRYEVSPALVDSVIQVESNYNPFAVSPKGAQGLMQLMPATARRFGVRDSFDPKDNIEGGVKYLKFLQETFKDDRLAIAAYNAGEGAVQKYKNNVPPYPETVNYVAQVGRKYSQAQQTAENLKKTIEPVAKEQDKPAQDYHPPLTAFVDSEGKLHIETK